MRPKGSDEAFCQKLITTYHNKSEHFDKPKFSQIQVPRGERVCGARAHGLEASSALTLPHPLPH